MASPATFPVFQPSKDFLTFSKTPLRALEPSHKKLSNNLNLANMLYVVIYLI